MNKDTELSYRIQMKFTLDRFKVSQLQQLVAWQPAPMFYAIPQLISGSV